MGSLEALALCIVICLVTSALLFAAISRPLGAFVRKVCPEPESVGFWLRFTVVMLFLAPLFVAVTFGLPSAAIVKILEAGELIQRIVTSALIGAFFATIGMGFWVSSLARRAPLLSQRSSNATPAWGEKGSV